MDHLENAKIYAGRSSRFSGRVGQIKYSKDITNWGKISNPSAMGLLCTQAVVNLVNTLANYLGATSVAITSGWRSSSYTNNHYWGCAIDARYYKNGSAISGWTVCQMAALHGMNCGIGYMPHSSGKSAVHLDCGTKAWFIETNGGTGWQSCDFSGGERSGEQGANGGNVSGGFSIDINNLDYSNIEISVDNIDLTAYGSIPLEDISIDYGVYSPASGSIDAYKADSSYSPISTSTAGTISTENATVVPTAEGLLRVKKVGELPSESGTKNIAWLLNETPATAEIQVKAGEPLFFKYSFKENTKAKINEIRLYHRSPLTNKNDPAAYLKEMTYEENQYYVIIPLVDISGPYVALGVDLTNDINEFCLEKVELFPAVVKYSKDQNQLQNLHDGDKISEEPSTDPNVTDMNYFMTPEEIMEAYTKKTVKYFYRNNYLCPYTYLLDSEEERINPYSENTVTYLPNEWFEPLTQEQAADKKIPPKSIFKFIKKRSEDGTLDYAIVPFVITKENIEDEFSYIYHEKEGSLPNPDDVGERDIYLYNGKYYQYYKIFVEKNGYIQEGGKWDLAFLGDGNNDKRRTLVASKSNRFNLIQELSELFKVWPVFRIEKLPNGVLSKQFWFREDCLNDNHAGFHKTVNLKGITRNVQSDNVVTKIYIENVESDISENGFVSISNAQDNPWGENYLYNFRYYEDQGLIDRKILSFDKDNLYTKVKGYNDTIKEKNEYVISLKMDLQKLRSEREGLLKLKTAAEKKAFNLNLDLQACNNGGSSETMRIKKQESKDYYDSLVIQYEEEIKIYDERIEKIANQYDYYSSLIRFFTQAKKDAIKLFEQKYLSFIKEGVWSDTSYADDDSYYRDACQVCETSSLPLISWTINVLDGSCFMDLKDFQFKVGDRTFIIDDDLFANQGFRKGYQFEILITAWTQCLDNPTKNTYEARNYLTSFDDLFQRVSAATQTLELKEQLFNRSANFENGTVKTEVIQKTLLDNQLTLAKSGSGALVIDDEGLASNSIKNPCDKLEFNSEGVFVEDIDEKGEKYWKQSVGPNGINADTINTGEINPSKVAIFNRENPGTYWDGTGLYIDGKKVIVKDGKLTIE